MKNKIEHTQPSDSSLKVGQFYRHEDGETYLLAEVTSESFSLICLDDGGRWLPPRKAVGDAFDHHRDEFTLITSPFTVTPSHE